jgi:hypothetical protein
MAPLLPGGMEWRGLTFDLGTGDIVLFMVTGGRAVGVDTVTAASTCVGVLAGVAATVVLAVAVAAARGRPGSTATVTLPALPGALTFGVTAYFGARYLLSPFLHATVVSRGFYF